MNSTPISRAYSVTVLIITEAQRSVGLLEPGTLTMCWVSLEFLKYLNTPRNSTPLSCIHLTVSPDMLNQRRTSLASERQWVYSMKKLKASSLV